MDVGSMIERSADPSLRQQKKILVLRLYTPSGRTPTATKINAHQP